MHELLTSIKNPAIQSLRALNKNRGERVNQGRFIAEGEHMAGEALRAGCASHIYVTENSEKKYKSWLDLAGEQQLPITIVSDPVMSVLCDAKTPQGILAVCPMNRMPEFPLPDQPGILVALDDVQDPGNVGTILRTVDALGFAGVVESKGCADVFAPKTLRASMGAVFRVPTAETENLPDTLRILQKNGYDIMAGTLDGQPFYERGTDNAKICVVIGNEGAGISEAVLSCATRRVRLPMRGGAESLNAAVACAVMLYDILRNSEP